MSYSPLFSDVHYFQAQAIRVSGVPLMVISLDAPTSSKSSPMDPANINSWQNVLPHPDGEG